MENVGQTHGFYFVLSEWIAQQTPYMMVVPVFRRHSDFEFNTCYSHDSKDWGFDELRYRGFLAASDNRPILGLVAASHYPNLRTMNQLTLLMRKGQRAITKAMEKDGATFSLSHGKRLAAIGKAFKVRGVLTQQSELHTNIASYVDTWIAEWQARHAGEHGEPEAEPSLPGGQLYIDTSK